MWWRRATCLAFSCVLTLLLWLSTAHPCSSGKAISGCESSLQASGNISFLSQLKFLEAGVRDLTEGGEKVRLGTPCWTRHLQPGLVTTMGLDASELPERSGAAIAMTALMQEAHVMQGALRERQELTTQAEQAFLAERAGSRQALWHDRVQESKAKATEILTRLDEIDADIKWLSLASSVDIMASRRQFKMDDATFCGGGEDIVPLSDLEDRGTKQEVFSGHTPMCPPSPTRR